ncbi:TetR/AcrR family transcriptional regulator [Allonocardiopsis opalescens]|uniref:TetR family transcriptional regulator n=1 Tax=Allonocardiopsis opalescens TaxID=1144618 RepID=A0A2T0PXC9_9ACTN|nr:TetR family transcriptional regulator [Allonocardiopsis opalescens]PRX96197.1 TetR family transcriptional regulator [Allonocardiopsis opalescens]
MTSPAGPAEPAGLRERKKARTRREIQRHALRLFRDEGYAATTVERIAAAAEVAPSTVFRYFPTKEDLVALDDYHGLGEAVAAGFARQPPELSALGALRAALRDAFAALSPADRAARNERDVLIVAVPELWAANLGMVQDGLRAVGALVAERSGRTADDPAVRALCAAVLGVALGVLLDAARDPGLDPAEELDAALGRLEEGVAL